jgi:RNA polymerase sigma factor (sigma-70 family)
MSITIFLADDHTVVRDGLRLILETQSDLIVVGQAANGREAVQQVLKQHPDVVIMDITMPDLNGIEATQQIHEYCPESHVIILSMHASSKHVFRALQAGAEGYLLKGSASSEVIQAVRTVHSGRRYLSQKISELLNEEVLRSLTATNEVEDPLARLSPREREVLQLVVEGRSSAEIAEMLHLSPKTVDTYRYRVMQKLNLSDLPSLVKFAIQHGLTPLE